MLNTQIVLLFTFHNKLLLNNVKATPNNHEILQSTIKQTFNNKKQLCQKSEQKFWCNNGITPQSLHHNHG